MNYINFLQSIKLQNFYDRYKIPQENSKNYLLNEIIITENNKIEIENNKIEIENNKIEIESNKIEKESNKIEKENNKIEREFIYHKKYLEVAQKISELSHANKKKVGSIIVKNSVIISDGYNGTPSGYENKCEDQNGKTKWYTLHSEANAITKLVRTGGISAKNATLYTTLSPCKECAKLILQSGINNVFYLEEYKDKMGIDFLSKSGINICQLIE